MTGEPVRLSRTRRLLDRAPTVLSNQVMFAQCDEDVPSGPCRTVLLFDTDTFEDMGSPDQITVSIVPGSQFDD